MRKKMIISLAVVLVLLVALAAPAIAANFMTTTKRFNDNTLVQFSVNISSASANASTIIQAGGGSDYTNVTAVYSYRTAVGESKDMAGFAEGVGSANRPFSAPSGGQSSQIISVSHEAYHAGQPLSEGGLIARP
jgi:hypothetical protein